MGAGIGILPGSVLCRVLFLVVVDRIEAARGRRVNRYCLRRGEAVRIATSAQVAPRGKSRQHPILTRAAEPLDQKGDTR
jgi:hypothetical protein